MIKYYCSIIVLINCLFYPDLADSLYQNFFVEPNVKRISRYICKYSVHTILLLFVELSSFNSETNQLSRIEWPNVRVSSNLYENGWNNKLLISIKKLAIQI